MRRESKAYAHGKVILIGEHSVVYGAPAIALPLLSRGVSVKLEITDYPSYLKTNIYEGNLGDAPESLKGIQTLIEHLIRFFELEGHNFKISINSSLPMHRGMGSSAAVSVAIIKAFYILVDKEVNEDELREHAYVSESIHHNSPSGLDVETIIANKAIYFVRNHEPIQLSLDINAFLVIADSGVTGSTSQAVLHFKEVLHSQNKDDLLKELTELSSNALDSLNTKDLNTLGLNMIRAHEILREFGVSTNELDSMVKVALDNGALGAKLTGSGMGGCMMALCKDLKSANQVSDALKSAGALDTIISKMEDNHE